MKTPKTQIILDYEMFFEEEPPANRISIINHLSKESVLREIVSLNYRLKPKYEVNIDASFETQVKELKHFTQSNELFNKYLKVVQKHTESKTNYPIIFNRQACLFAIEEIISSSEILSDEVYVLSRNEDGEAIFKYFLAVNYIITQIKEEKENNELILESLNAKLLPLNELQIETDPLFTPYRGYCLIDFFLNNEKPDIKEHVISYFKKNYGIEPQYFIFLLWEMYLTNHTENPALNYFYSVHKERQYFYDKLSIRNPNKAIYKLINIRKSPFINVGKLKYFIADTSFLLEKSYAQFLNDFWFDWIKNIKDENGNDKFTIEIYRSKFGLFFEKYISTILKKCFENYEYSTLLMFDQLKIHIHKKPSEIADVYFRYNNKILLGQVKSGSIYDAEKFGGDMELLYKNDRNNFFKNFGVNQLVESLTRMDNYILKFDPRFPKGHTYEIYPCIIVNDKAFQTPLMPNTFNTRFQELIKDFNIKKVKVNPLTVIHISDFERLEVFLNKNPQQIWELLKYNHRNKKLILPFYDTINRNRIGRQYPARINELFKSLKLRYNSNKTKT